MDQLKMLKSKLYIQYTANIKLVEEVEVYREKYNHEANENIRLRNLVSTLELRLESLKHSNPALIQMTDMDIINET